MKRKSQMNFEGKLSFFSILSFFLDKNLTENEKNLTKSKFFPKTKQILPFSNFKRYFSKTSKKPLNERQRFHRKPRKSHISLASKFINQLKLLLKIRDNLRFRTKFRNLRLISENQIEMMNDKAFFSEKKQMNNFVKRSITEKNVIFK